MCFSWLLVCIVLAAFSVGVILAFVLPPWLLVIIQAVFIICVTFRSFKKK